MNDIIARRLEFLEMEAKGFSLCEIVKVLSEKWQKTERTIYYDAETRNSWQPLLTQLHDLDKALLMVLNRYEYLYRKASFNLEQCQDMQRPVYLKLMLEITNNLVTILGLESVKTTQYQEQCKMKATDAERLLALAEKRW